MDYELIISFGELFKGLLKSKRGVMWKDSVAGYFIHGLKNTYRLRHDLLKRQYRLSLYQLFYITEPKLREIIATRIRDRQFQRSLCDNILYPETVKHYIRDNCACQKGRGIDDALNRMEAQLHKYYRKHGSDGWVLQCDLKKYFPSIDHDVVNEMLRKYIDDFDAYVAACEVIESFCYSAILKHLIELGYDRLAKKTVNLAHRMMIARVSLLRIRLTGKGDAERIKTRLHKALLWEKNGEELYQWVMNTNFVGIGLGSQVSQIVALTLLNELDHFIKEKLHIKHYVRYMDDFILIHPDKAYLQYCKTEIEKYLQSLKLTLNDKTHIYQLKQGIIFLKWRYLLTDTGKVVRKMSDQSITKQRRKMRKFVKRLEEGKMTMNDVYMSYQSWRANALRGDTKSIVHKMDLYYKNLYGKEWDDETVYQSGNDELEASSGKRAASG